MEEIMEGSTPKTLNWSKYYQNHKKIWYDPSIPLPVKAVLRLVELHRSDSKGWSISTRKAASLLGVAKNTAMEAFAQALNMGLLEASTKGQRKRRKLRLSGSLRVPIEYDNYENNGGLGTWERQPGTPQNTEAGATTETVNNNPNSKLNTIPQAENFETKTSYKKENSGYLKLREAVKSLRLRKKVNNLI